jgi:hypothetical protein
VLHRVARSQLRQALATLRAHRRHAHAVRALLRQRLQGGQARATRQCLGQWVAWTRDHVARGEGYQEAERQHMRCRLARWRGRVERRVWLRHQAHRLRGLYSLETQRRSLVAWLRAYIQEHRLSVARARKQRATRRRLFDAWRAAVRRQALHRLGSAHLLRLSARVNLRWAMHRLIAACLARLRVQGVFVAWRATARAQVTRRTKLMARWARKAATRRAFGAWRRVQAVREARRGAVWAVAEVVRRGELRLAMARVRGVVRAMREMERAEQAASTLAMRRGLARLRRRVAMGRGRRQAVEMAALYRQNRMVQQALFMWWALTVGASEDETSDRDEQGSEGRESPKSGRGGDKGVGSRTGRRRIIMLFQRPHV